MIDLISNVLAIHVGRPRRFDTGNDGKEPWTSGIMKSAVSGQVRVGRLNLDGDEQADLIHHGGPDKAVLVYPVVHYGWWRDEFPSIDWQPGTFGENLTIEGAMENVVCIGDVFELGSCKLQVSQPRQPCWKLSRRWGLPKLAVRVQQTGRTGWYLRVIDEGMIGSSETMKLIERNHPQWTIAKANAVMFAKPQPRKRFETCPMLIPVDFMANHPFPTISTDTWR